LEQSDNVAERDHAFAMLKRGYTRRAVIGPETELRTRPVRKNLVALRARLGPRKDVLPEPTPVLPGTDASARFPDQLSLLLTCLA
jgi:hypothetical protein